MKTRRPKKVKSLILVLLFVLQAAFFAACGSKNTEEQDPPAAQENESVSDHPEESGEEILGESGKVDQDGWVGPYTK